MTYFSLFYTMSFKCNLHCGYCFRYDYAKAVPEELSLEGMEKVIAHLYDHFNIRKITLSGGEPSMLGGVPKTNFLKLINFLRKYKSKDPEKNLRIVLISNAVYLTPDVTEKMIGVVDRITVTLDSTSDAILTKLGRNFDVFTNYLERTELRLQDFTKKGFEVKLHSVVSKINIDGMDDLVNFVINLKDTKIISWKFYQYMTFGNQKVDDIYSVTKEQYYQVANKEENKLAKAGIKPHFKDTEEQADTMFDLVPDGTVQYYKEVNGVWTRCYTKKKIFEYSSWDDLRKDCPISDKLYKEHIYLPK
jgi:molybdenum cofactor biosynthesis enzyme MoaA